MRKKRLPIDYIEPRLREVWSWSEGKRVAREKSLIRRIKQVSPRGRVTYIEYHRCALCPANKEYLRRLTHVDHIEPVVPVGKTRPTLREPGIAKGFDTYIARMWCSPNNLQVLCIAHHREKTRLENEKRRELKLI